MLIRIDGNLHEGVTAKDMILYVIGIIGTAGATGYTIEFGGEAIKSLSIESRMTVCNMSIEAGARAGIIAVDSKTISYLKGKKFTPEGDLWDKAKKYWENLKSDVDAQFDKTVIIEADKIQPMVTWGTSPEMVEDINSTIPKSIGDKNEPVLLSLIHI